MQALVLEDNGPAGPVEDLHYIEVDVQETRDGELVVFHDAGLSRAFPYTGPNVAAFQKLQLEGHKRDTALVKELTTSELRSLHVAGRPGLHAPTLADFLAALRAAGCRRPTVIEVKQIATDKEYKHPHLGFLAVISFPHFFTASFGEFGSVQWRQWAQQFTNNGIPVSMFTPISSYSLCIDYYEAAFPGAQLAVKVTVCYELAFVTLQVICHLADARLPVSRAARIELRHVVVALLMLFIVVWERVLVGPDLHHPNASSLPIFLATVTFTGAMDGICVGAMFGEAAVLGPASAHALVAGTSGVMPLLAVMRIVFKAALPATTHGMRLSVVLYFAAAAGVLLAGLAVYRLVVLRAVAAAVCCTYSGNAKQYKDELGVLPLVPVLGVVQDDDDDDDNRSRDEESGRKMSSQLTRHGTLGMTLALPSSMRGMPVLVRRVHTGMAPTLLRMGTMEGAVDGFARTETLQSRATAAGHLHGQNVWSAGTMRPNLYPSQTLGCGDGRKALDTSNESFTTRWNTIADQFAMDSLFNVSLEGSGPNSIADSTESMGNGSNKSSAPSSQTRSFKSVKSVRFIEDEFVESGLISYSPKAARRAGAQSSCDTASYTSDTDSCETGSSYCSWESTTDFFVIKAGDQEGQAGPATAEQWSSRESAASGSQAGAGSRWSKPQSSTSMQRAMSVGSQPKNPYCLWAVESTPFTTPASSVLGFPSDSGVSLAMKLKDADVDVFADPKEMKLSKAFSDALNNAAMKPGFLRAATAAGVVEPVLEEMLLRVATAAPEEPRYFGEGINMWRSNWLTIKDNKWYMLATVLTYTCNYGVFPAFVAFTVQLLPIWKPRKPQATIMGVACARLVIFFLVFVVALLLHAPPVVYFFAVFLLSLSGWYEAMIFSLACDGHHPQDAYQVESLLAIQLDVGIALGSVLSLAWAAGPWAVGVQAAGVAHG
eukprot:gene12603-12734_t